MLYTGPAGSEKSVDMLLQKVARWNMSEYQFRLVQLILLKLTDVFIDGFIHFVIFRIHFEALFLPGAIYSLLNG